MTPERHMLAAPSRLAVELQTSCEKNTILSVQKLFHTGSFRNPPVQYLCGTIVAIQCEGKHTSRSGVQKLGQAATCQIKINVRYRVVYKLGVRFTISIWKFKMARETINKIHVHTCSAQFHFAPNCDIFDLYSLMIESNICSILNFY